MRCTKHVAGPTLSNLIIVMQGYINMIVQERNWVTVEGLNCEYVRMGESRDFPGMMIKVEKPLLVTTDIRNQF
jgi:hypothetical protein